MDIDLVAAGEAAIAAAGLVEVVKRAARLPAEWEDRLLPLLALIAGVLWTALFLSVREAPDQRWQTILLMGLVAGMIASGTWSQATSLIRGFTTERKVAVPGPGT